MVAVYVKYALCVAAGALLAAVVIIAADPNSGVGRSRKQAPSGEQPPASERGPTKNEMTEKALSLALSDNTWEYRSGCTPKDIAAGYGLKRNVIMAAVVEAGMSAGVRWDEPLTATAFARLAAVLSNNNGSAAQEPRKQSFRFLVQRKPQGTGPSRVVLCQDVKQWLTDQGDSLPAGMSVITSFPDVTETPYDLAVWKVWFMSIAEETLRKLRPGQCAIFYQSDIKVFNKRTKQCEELVHKVGLVAAAAARVPGAALFWHRVATYAPLDKRQPMGVGRPQMTHIVCYGKGAGEGGAAASASKSTHSSSSSSSSSSGRQGSADPEAGSGIDADADADADKAAAENGDVDEDAGAEPVATYDARLSLAPDIFDRGRQLWTRGMGIQAAHIVADFLATRAPSHGTRSVACLFCGVGTAVAMVNAVGLDAVGVVRRAGMRVFC